MKKILAVLLTIALLLPCVALADSNPMIGSWNGTIQDIPTTFTFCSDYTLCCTMGAYGSLEGTYSLSGNQLLMIVDDSPITATVYGDMFTYNGLAFTKQNGAGV